MKKLLLLSAIALFVFSCEKPEIETSAKCRYMITHITTEIGSNAYNNIISYESESIPKGYTKEGVRHIFDYSEICY